jgi:FdhD protein
MTHTHDNPHRSAARRPVARLRDGVVEQMSDAVVVEEPLEIRVAGRAVAITMRTPGHDDELAAGFCLTEGIIAEPGELAMVEPCEEADYGNIVNVELASEAMQRNAERIACATREVYMSSSCGLCGKQSIDRIRQQVPAIRGDFTVAAEALQRWPDVMRTAQATFDATGGLHAAAVFSPTGEMRVLREDVGRHNAVDKAIGRLVLDDAIPCDPGVLLVSGRASFEIMQKAAMAGIAMVCAVSAPSSLAVDFAVELDMTLVGFLRTGRLNVYHDPGRLILPQ